MKVKGNRFSLGYWCGLTFHLPFILKDIPVISFFGSIITCGYHSESGRNTKDYWTIGSFDFPYFPNFVYEY